MADAQANINVNLDATRALAQLKNLQRQISVFNAEIARGGAQAAAGAARMQQNLASGINATGQFSATMARTKTTTESFTNALEKNKLSMGQYFRYAGGATQKFGHLFSKEMGVIDKVARERVKTLQTQYVKLGRDASGAMKSIAVRPLALDMENVATKTAIAAQKQQIFNQLLKQGSTNLLNWGKNTQWAGRQLMVGFTIPLAIFGSAASSSFLKLEEQAIKFKRVYGDLFTTPQQADQAFADMQKLGQEFTRFGVSVEETLGLAAKAAQMGNMGAELTAQVTEATRLAVLGGMQQEEALDTTISLTNAFGVSAEDLTQKINFLNAAENQTILSIQDFNTAVPKAGSVVAQLGGDVEDLAFFLTAMREGGVNASQGANALKSSLGRLINPTQRAKDALAGYGIDVVGIVEENQGNLRQTVLDLGVALDQLDPLEKARAIETLFGKFQFARMSALFQNIMDEGSQASTILGLINSEAGELSQLASKELGRVEESAATQFRSAVEQFQAALAPIGESFLKLVTPIIEFGTKILNVFNNLSDGAKAVVVGIIGVVGGIGPILLMTIGLMANGIANLMKGFAFFRERLLNIRQGTTDLGSSTQYMTQEQLEAAAVAASLGQEHAELRQIFTTEKVAVDNLRAAYERMTATQRGALGVSGAVAATTAGAAGRAKGFRYGKKVPGYKDGIVMVPGRKGEGDTQPAMLAPGEAVIPAKMAERYGPLINAMIAGNIPGYSKGRSKQNISVGSASYEIDASESQAIEIQRMASVVAESVDGGVDIIAEAFARMRDDLKVTAKSFVRELETVSAELYDNEPGRVRKAVGREVSYKSSATGKTGTVEQNLVAARGGAGQEEYDRAVSARDGSLKALEEHYRKAGKSEEEIKKILAQRSQIVRAHVAEVDNVGKMYQEGWDESLWVAQTESENQLSNTLVESQATREEYLRHLRDLGLDTETQDELIRKINSNLALTEDELEVQARVLQSMLADSSTMQAVSSGFESQAVGTIGAMEGRRQAGPASAGVGVRTTAEVSAGTAKLNQAKSRNVSGEMMSIAQAEARELDLVARNGTRLMVDSVSNAMQQELQAGLQSSSPSQVMRNEMGNAVDGAVLAVQEGQDDMQVAGEQLADSVESGVRSGTGTGKTGRRVTVSGPITPTAAVDTVAKQTKNFGRRVEGAAIKVAGMGAKIGGVGIGLSSLIGGLTMIDGPLGEFTSKLFPIISLMTGLSFALQMLNAETIKGVGAAIATRRAKTAEATATIKNTVSEELSRISEIKNQKITDIDTAAEARSTNATNVATTAIGRFTRAVQAAATRAGVAAAIGPQVITAGTPLQRGATAVGARGAAAAGATGAAAGRIGGALQRMIAPVVGVFSKSIAGVSKIAVGFGTVLRKLGAVGGIVIRGLGTVLGAIIGVSSTVALVIAGLALLAGGIFLLVKIMNDQKAKIEGLGDAANISAEKLDGLSESLGIEGSGARAAVLESAASPELAGETEESKKEVIDVKNQFIELIDTNKDFKKEWKGTINALKSGSQEAAQASMEMLAVSLQTEGYTEEQIQGVVSALLEEAGRTDVRIDFSSISLETQQGALDSAAQDFIDSVEKTVYTYQGEELKRGLGIKFDQASLDLFAESTASAIININAQFDQGLISLEQYEAELEAIRQKIIAIGQERGGIAATEAARATVQSLDPEGNLGLEDQTAGLLEGETTRGATAAVTVAQAEVAGVDVSETDIATLETGLSEDATAAQIIAYETLIAEIDAATEAQKELNKETAEQDKLAEDVKSRAGQIEEETDALLAQADAFNQAYEAASENENIENPAAIAEMIAADPTEQERFNQAQAEGKEALDAYLQSLDARVQAEKDLQAAQNAAKVAEDQETQLQGLRDQKSAYDQMIAAGFSAEEAAQASTDASVVQAITLGQLDFETYKQNLRDIAELQAEIDEEIGANLPGNDNGNGTGGGGAPEEPPSSFLDDIVKQYRSFGNASQELTKGFDASLEAIMGFAKGGSWGLNGLSRQLRNVNVSETMIEKFLGMEPEEWDKYKKELFEVDEAGNITGLTEKGEAVQQAEASATIAEETDSIEAQTKATQNQLTAFDKLVANGASVKMAYDMIQNENIASAVATSKNTAEVKRLISAQQELSKLEAELEEIDEEEQRKERIREAVKGMNEEFENQVKALNKIRSATDEYTDAQIEAIMGNKDLRSLFLEPEIAPGELKKALENAEKREKLELDIQLLTFDGREDFLNEAFKKAKDKFSAEETRIELAFEADLQGAERIIEEAQNEIDGLTYIIDDYQAQLDEIQYREDEINEKYDKRFEALDRIASINDRIAAQQQSQLDLAEALSRGDIAAAAQAAQAAREQEMTDNTEAQREMMEMRREAELKSIKSLGGMTREQLEDQIDSLNRKITSIEEQRLEPQEEYIRLAELRRDREIENLEVLGRTSTQWDEIQNALDVARTRNYEFMNEMQKQFDMYPEILAKYLEGEPLPAPPALPKPPPPPRRSEGKPSKWEGGIVRINGKRYSREDPPGRGGHSMAAGGLVARMAMGGYIKGGMFTNMAVGGPVPYKGKGGSSTRMAMGGSVKGYPMGGLIPYKNAGGMFKSLGSDTIPAMLTPGEFVIRRPAVSGFGVDNLEKINRGTYNDGSVYNYNLAVNVKSDSNPEQIANTVMRELKRVDSQRMRNNRY